VLAFVPGTTHRMDNPYGYPLKYIKLYNNAGQAKKTFELFTSYFDSERMKLDSVKEEDGTHALPPYAFTYNTDHVLPNRISYQTDHWGYYNGASGNTTPLAYRFYIGSYYIDKGADKRPNPVFSNAYTLTSVKYPTGGSMNIDYEGNKFLTNDANYIDRYVGKDTTLALVSGHNDATTYDFNFSQTFTIDNNLLGGHTNLKTMVSLWYDGVDPATCDCQVRVKILGGPGNTTTYFDGANNGSYPYQVTLGAGTYTLTGEIMTDINGVPYIEFGANVVGKYAPYVTDNYVEADGPGIRVKKITKHFTGGVNEQISYDYNLAGKTYTSGLVGNLPNYTYQNVDMYHAIIDFGGDQADYYYGCNCNVYSSSSNYPLVSTRSSSVGYSQVTETRDNGHNGKTVYTYTNYDTYNDLNPNPDYPFIPSISEDWKRGLPVHEVTYKYNNGSYTPVMTKGWAYERSSDSTVRTPRALKIGAMINYKYSVPDVTVRSDLSTILYNSVSDALPLVADTTTIYDGGVGLTTTNVFTNSEKNYMVKQIQTTNSDYSVATQNFYYPIDYASNAASSAVLDSMLVQNMVNIPVEQISRKTVGTNTSITGAVLYQYDFKYDATAGKNRVILKKIFDNNLFDTNTSSTYDFLTLPTRYTEKYNYADYNAKGFPLAYTTRQVVSTGYQWGYNNAMPVAECKNALNTEFFVQNYEEPGSGGTNTITAHTGGNCYAGSTATVSWTRPNSRNYIIEYWYHTGGVWKLGSSSYTGSSYTTTGGDAYDDIRIYPADAQMTTYTYDPLVGMTSSTDAKGQTTYYEYDSFQRLTNVKDKDGNILKHTDYHYQNQ
jgi:YD repeat-containing protein